MVGKGKARGKANPPKGKAVPPIVEVAGPKGWERGNPSDTRSDVRNVASKAKDNNARR